MLQSRYRIVYNTIPAQPFNLYITSIASAWPSTACTDTLLCPMQHHVHNNLPGKIISLCTLLQIDHYNTAHANTKHAIYPHSTYTLNKNKTVSTNQINTVRRGLHHINKTQICLVTRSGPDDTPNNMKRLITNTGPQRPKYTGYM